MRNTPPKQPLNYGNSADLPSPCLPSLGSRRIRPNYMSGQTRLYHHKERMINQPTARNDTHTPVSTKIKHPRKISGR
ncbi:hypothetical protein RHMOL_Rhmol08G0144900 [Rhododendron molle]|uniref:Uncharacterized protein n=1 Tax=Rhododendron molle TaxID=49168 RepID=A0ACC0MNR8_RHOML|nr:hypothetical protein RHMOL_Rhmol08G0144900 [Rhododendron molle]